MQVMKKSFYYGNLPFSSLLNFVTESSKTDWISIKISKHKLISFIANVKLTCVRFRCIIFKKSNPTHFIKGIFKTLVLVILKIIFMNLEGLNMQCSMDTYIAFVLCRFVTTDGSVVP